MLGLRASADPRWRRLAQHQARELWTTAYAFTSRVDYLNKAHAQHLEAEPKWTAFTVLKGAKGRRDFTPGSPDGLMRTREQLIRQGVLAKYDNQVELLQDYEFKSPSQAAGHLLARSANGRLEWKDAAGITLKDRQDRAAAAASADADQ